MATCKHCGVTLRTDSALPPGTPGRASLVMGGKAFEQMAEALRRQALYCPGCQRSFCAACASKVSGTGAYACPDCRKPLRDPWFHGTSSSGSASGWVQPGAPLSDGDWGGGAGEVPDGEELSQELSRLKTLPVEEVPQAPQGRRPKGTAVHVWIIAAVALAGFLAFLVWYFR